MSLGKNKKLVGTVGALLALLLCGAALLPLLARPSNCGGNSAALAACKSVAGCFRLIASERGAGALAITDLSGDEREYFSQIGGQDMLGEANILVSAKAVMSEKKIVAVCDAPFNNVPCYRFRKAASTHAVAYSDGSTALIPVAEFQQLDLREFVDLKMIQPGKLTSN
jgi:hypothetical protein